MGGYFNISMFQINTQVYNNNNTMYRKLKFGDIVFRFLPEYQVWHTGLVYDAPTYLCNNHNNVDCDICGKKSYLTSEVVIVDFDNNNLITMGSLSEFLYGRKYFWVYNFFDEYKIHCNRIKSQMSKNYSCSDCKNKSIIHSDKESCIESRSRCIICKSCRRCVICMRPVKMFKSDKSIKRTVDQLMKEQPITYTINRFNCEYFTRRCTIHDEQMHDSPQTSKILQSNTVLITKLLSAAFLSIAGGVKADKNYEKNLRSSDVSYLVNSDGSYEFANNSQNRANAKEVEKMRSLKTVFVK